MSLVRSLLAARNMTRPMKPRMGEKLAGLKS